MVNSTLETKMCPRGKEETMKKLLSVMAIAMLVGTVSWGAIVESTNVASQVDITLKAKLSTGAKVTEKSLEGTNDLSVVTLQIIDSNTVSAAVTTNEEDVIARGVVADTNGVLTSATILLKEKSGVDLKHNKFVNVFESAGVDTNNAVWVVFGTQKTTTKKGVTTTTITGKVEGIWQDTVSAFKGTIGKVKKGK